MIELAVTLNVPGKSLRVTIDPPPIADTAKAAVASCAPEPRCWTANVAVTEYFDTQLAAKVLTA